MFWGFILSLGISAAVYALTAPRASQVASSFVVMSPEAHGRCVHYILLSIAQIFFFQVPRKTSFFHQSKQNNKNKKHL